MAKMAENGQKLPKLIQKMSRNKWKKTENGQKCLKIDEMAQN